MNLSIASHIAVHCDRIRTCQERQDANTSFNIADARAHILYYEQHCLPHGSGIDSGVATDTKASSLDRLVMKVPYHAMDENGYYCGWFNYRVVTRMTFLGIHVTVTGGRKRDRDYIRDTMAHALEYVPTSEELYKAQREVYRAE